MKLYAIGIFNLQGQTQAFDCEKTAIGKKASEYISQTLIAKLKNSTIPIDKLYKLNKDDVFYYLIYNGRFIYTLASPNEINISEIDELEALNDCFDDLKNLSDTNYHKLSIKIENADIHISALKKAQDNVREAKDAALESMEKVLARGERIEVLLDKTNTLVENNVRLPVVKKKPHTKSETCLNRLYSLFCCVPKKMPKNEWELSEPLLHRYKDGRKF